jgi:hypothetical protein
MASIILATTTNGMSMQSDNSGVLQLASGTGNLVTIPSVTGTAMVSGNMPAFSAYATGSNSVANNSFTKITLNAEEFDTAGYFDSTTNYRFTPLIAGYYQFSCAININNAASGIAIASFFKNGSEFKRCGQTELDLSSSVSPSGSALIYMNGSTDYVELYCLQNSGGTVTTSSSGSPYVYMTGSLVRTA